MNILVTGSNGRMGREIIKLARNNDSTGEIYGLDKQEDKLADHWLKRPEEIKDLSVELVIDFSTPQLLSEIIPSLRGKKSALVSGTTGIDSKHKEAMMELSADIPVLWAANMSIGIAILSEALKCFSKIKGFEFQIEEFHHSAKVDNPSGTAIHLQECLQEQVEDKLPEPIGIRGGGIFGIHKIHAMGGEEVISFEHLAFNRRVFARGALSAGEWLVEQPPAYYGFADFFNARR